MINFDILKELGNLKNPSIKETSKFSHTIHPYPAKYIPQIPEKIISKFTNERHIILDPFSGSGTSLLESKLLGRDSIGVDLNPIGVLISRVKTYTITKEDIKFFEVFKSKLIESFVSGKNKNLWIPPIPNIDHWFSKTAIVGLSKIVSQIREIENINRRRILNLIFSNIIVNVSNQESETRFAAKEKKITSDNVLEVFLKKYDQVVDKLVKTSATEKFKTAEATVHLANSLTISEILKPNSIDLVVTSPPYLNSFDYYLYHKFRINWLSYPENLGEVLPVKQIQELEIGSRYKYSGVNGEAVSIFRDEMKACFTSLNTILKPSKLLFLVVGDSIVKGEFFKMDDYYENILDECGFKLLSKVSNSMSGASKSFNFSNANNKHFNTKQSHIIAFQSLNLSKKNGADQKIVIPSLKLPDAIEVQELPAGIQNGSNFFINTNKVTEYTHGLVKYPAKYIPQIPLWAIKNYSKKGDLVFDPFNGSGTTSLECLLNERNCIGTDVNPLAILASDVKTTYIPYETTQQEIKTLISKIKSISKTGKFKKIEFELEEFWFNPKTLNEIFLIKSAIEGIKNENVKKLMLVSLSSIVKKVSYLDEGQLKVKRDASKVLNNSTNNVQELFLKRLAKDALLVSKLKAFATVNTTNKHEIGSAYNFTSFLKLQNKVDLIVTSPPYINAMNYPMYHRYELLLLGLIKPEDYIEHQTAYIGTERVYSKDYKSIETFLPGSKSFKELNEKLKAIHTGEPKRYFITKKYFEEMYLFFKESYIALKKGKKLVIVCGTNTIKGVPINTSLELAKIAEVAGFKKLFYFSYEIRKHRFKLTRHETAGKINNDIIVVLEK